MRIYVANAQTVQFQGAVLHFAGGCFYNVADAMATAMVRDQVAETETEYAARVDAGIADPRAEPEGRMHAAGASAGAEPIGQMHPPTAKGVPAAPVVDLDSDETFRGIDQAVKSDPVLDASPEFVQASAADDAEVLDQQ